METVSVDIILMCSKCGMGVIVDKKIRITPGYILTLSPCQCKGEETKEGDEKIEKITRKMTR